MSSIRPINAFQRPALSALEPLTSAFVCQKSDPARLPYLPLTNHKRVAKEPESTAWPRSLLSEESWPWISTFGLDQGSTTDGDGPHGLETV